MAIGSHLPLVINENTPSTIKTAAGMSLSVPWTKSPAENPYAEAEEFAAFVVCAVNAYEANEALIKEMIEALTTAHQCLDMLVYPEGQASGVGITSAWAQAMDAELVSRKALRKAEARS